MKNLSALLVCAAFLMSCFTACEEEKSQEQECRDAELPGEMGETCSAINECYDRGWDTDELEACAEELDQEENINTWYYCGAHNWDYDCDRVRECVEACGDMDIWEP